MDALRINAFLILLILNVTHISIGKTYKYYYNYELIYIIQAEK